MLESRPRTRADCEGGPRPCPWVSCKYNLMLDVRESGSIVPSSGLIIKSRRMGRNRSEVVEQRRDKVIHVRAPFDEEHFVERLIEWFRRNNLPSCALDVADAGGATLEEIGNCLGITRERARQIERQALEKVGAETALGAALLFREEVA